MYLTINLEKALHLSSYFSFVEKYVHRAVNIKMRPSRDYIFGRLKLYRYTIFDIFTWEAISDIPICHRGCELLPLQFNVLNLQAWERLTHKAKKGPVLTS